MPSAGFLFCLLLSVAFTAAAAPPRARFSSTIADKSDAMAITGKLRIGPLREYAQVDVFKDGPARVWFSQRADTRGIWGYLDTGGKLVWRGP